MHGRRLRSLLLLTAATVVAGPVASDAQLVAEADNRESVSAIVARLESSDAKVRRAAVYALQRPDGKVAVPQLRRVARDDPDRLVRSAAVTALVYMGDQEHLGRALASGQHFAGKKDRKGLETIQLIVSSFGAADDGPAGKETRKKLLKTIDLKFMDADLKDFPEFVRFMTDLNIYTDWRGLARVGAEPRKKFSLSGSGRLGFVLGMMVWVMGRQQGEVSYRIVDGTVLIAPRAVVEDLVAFHARVYGGAAVRQNPAIQKKLQATITKVEFDGMGLGDVLETLKNAGSLQMEVDWPSLRTLGVTRNTPITLHLSKVPLDGVLRLVMFQAAGTGKMAYTVRRSTIVISKAPILTGARRHPVLPKSTDEQAAGRKLDLAHLYRKNGLNGQAETAYREIIRKYPDTNAAKAAGKALAEMRAPKP